VCWRNPGSDDLQDEKGKTKFESGRVARAAGANTTAGGEEVYFTEFLIQR